MSEISTFFLNCRDLIGKVSTKEAVTEPEAITASGAAVWYPLATIAQQLVRDS
jgi:hypothetical protein